MRSVRAWLRGVSADLSSGVSAEARAALVLAPALLIVYRYGLKPSAFRRFFAEWRSHPHFELYGYLWWYIGGGAFLCLAPWLISRALFGRRFRYWGARFGSWGSARSVVPIGVCMLCAVAAASFVPSFQQKYPLLDSARDRLHLFLLYQLLYGAYFFAWEFFFRGWLLGSLRRDFGWGAVWIQALPFALLHFGKPLPETLGSIPAGLYLGWLSYRSGSFLYGWLLHWSVAFFMDVSASFQVHLGASGG